MRVECRQAVSEAIGRQVNDVEVRGIEQRINDTMRRLAARDPVGWRAMSRGDRLRAAAEVAGRDLEHAAQLKEQRASLMVEAHSRHLPDVQAAGKDGFKVIQRKLDQADTYIRGVSQEYMRQALDAIDYATRQDRGSLVGRGLRWIANLEDPTKALAFVREVRGEDSGDAGAKAAAKAWVDSVEGMRRRFNAAGGDVRKLIYGYLPQPHDAGRVRDAGQAGWVRKVLPLVDRERYYNEAGRRLGDDELAEALGQAWQTIQSDGWNNVEVGAFRGELANAGSQARVIHFKDADGYVAYLRDFGEGGVFDALAGHIGWMSKNIGLVEEFGPNPSALVRTMLDTAKAAGGKDRVALLMDTEDSWVTLKGELDNPQSQSLARINQGIRNVEVFGKLQQATIQALTDVPMYFVTLGYNRLSFWKGTVNLVRAFGSETTRFADVAGLMTDSMIADMQPLTTGLLGPGWTGGVANATMKASFLKHWTGSVRRAFSVTMMAGMAQIRRTRWGELNTMDRARLARQGWTEAEWAVLQQAQVERWRNTDMLTPAAIARIEGVDEALKQRTISRLLGTIADESEYASVGANLAARTVMKGGLQAGTGNGELWRHLMLFKGTPTAILTRHFERMMHGDMTPAGRLLYSASFMFGTTLFGALALQLADLAAGRDPRDATGSLGDNPAQLAKFWGAAMAKGGGLGFLGDMLLTGQGRQGQSGASAALGGIAGPVAGSAFELVYDLGFQNMQEAAAGKDTHIGAEAFRWGRGHTPFVNLWYGKLTLDQAMLNQMQEGLSPGYLDRIKARSEREWGSTWWWAPEDTGLLSGDMQGPERAPNLAASVGDR